MNKCMLFSDAKRQIPADHVIILAKDHKLAISQLRLLPEQLILFISDASFNCWEKN